MPLLQVYAIHEKNAKGRTLADFPFTGIRKAITITTVVKVYLKPSAAADWLLLHHHLRRKCAAVTSYELRTIS